MRIILLFLFSFSIFAQYAPMSEVNSNSVTKVYARASSCPSDCIKIPVGYNSNFHRLKAVMVPDTERPVYSKNQISSCEELEREGCESLLADLECEIEGEEAKMVYEEGQKEVYCSKFLRYNMKDSGEKVVVVDEDLKAAYDAAQAQAIAQQMALKIAKQRMDCGKDVMALYFVRNAQKSPALSVAEVTQALTQFSPIKGLLEAGALESAKEAMLSVTIDGKLVTTEDKNALVSKIDSCVQ